MTSQLWSKAEKSLENYWRFLNKNRKNFYWQLNLGLKLGEPNYGENKSSNSNIEILQRFQSKTLKSLIDAAWYIINETIHRDLKIPTVKEEISKFSNKYNIRINNNQNSLLTSLLDTTVQIRRLRRHYPLDLDIRFS